MATYQLVDTIVPAGSGIASITRDLAQEAIAQIPSLIDWFDPAATWATGNSAAAFAVRGKRRGIRLLSPGLNRPVSEPAGINGQPALVFGDAGLPQTSTGNGYLTADDVALLTASYSIAFGCKLGATAAGSLLAGAATTTGFQVNIDSSGRLVVSQQASAGFVVRPANDLRGTTFVAVVGYRASTGLMTLRLNGAQVATGTTALPLTSNRLRVATSGAAGTTTAAAYFARLGEMLFFNADLTETARAAQLALVEARLRGLYGV